MERAYAKREIADAHLARALALFIDEGDFLCAITLAGAADEILGNLYRTMAPVETAGREAQDMPDARAAIDQEVQALQRVGKHFGDTIERRAAITSLNSARDAMKHHTAGGDPVTLDAADEAAEIIDRALRNVMQLDGNYPARIGEFDAKRRALEAERQRDFEARP